MEHLQTWAPVAITSKYLGFSSGGILQRAFGTAQLPTDFVSQSLLPPLFRTQSRSNSEQRLAYFSRSIGATALYLTPIAYIISYYSYETIYYLYGKKWLDAVPLLELFGFYLILFSVYLPCRATVAAATSLKFLATIRGISTLLFISYIWNYSEKGLENIIIAFLIIYFFETLILYVFTVILTGFPSMRIFIFFAPCTIGISVGHIVAKTIFNSSHILGLLGHMTIVAAIYVIVSVFIFPFNPEAKYIKMKIAKF